MDQLDDDVISKISEFFFEQVSAPSTLPGAFYTTQIHQSGTATASTWLPDHCIRFGAAALRLAGVGAATFPRTSKRELPRGTAAV